VHKVDDQPHCSRHLQHATAGRIFSLSVPTLSESPLVGETQNQILPEPVKKFIHYLDKGRRHATMQR